MGVKRSIKMIGFSGLVLLLMVSQSRAMGLSDFFEAGSAYLTHIVAHETGHNAMANMAGGRDVQMNFFQQKNGSFFAGVTSVGEIDRESVLPFRAAGLVASNYTFDLALSSYRAQPSTYNKSLLFFSGTDFLWYSVWSFYIKGSRDPGYDPVGISQETGLSSEIIVSAALVQTALNAFRIYSGHDSYIPYISVENERMNIGVRVRF